MEPLVSERQIGGNNGSGLHKGHMAGAVCYQQAYSVDGSVSFWAPLNEQT